MLSECMEKLPGDNFSVGPDGCSGGDIGLVAFVTFTTELRDGLLPDELSFSPFLMADDSLF